MIADKTKIEVKYCPECNYKIVITPSTFKCWNGKCAGCGKIKYAKFTT